MVATFDSEFEARDCVERLAKSDLQAYVELQVDQPGLPGTISVSASMWVVRVHPANGSMTNEGSMHPLIRSRAIIDDTDH